MRGLRNVMMGNVRPRRVSIAFLPQSLNHFKRLTRICSDRYVIMALERFFALKVYIRNYPRLVAVYRFKLHNYLYVAHCYSCAPLEI